MKTYYNCHTHIFNAECAPSGFYGRKAQWAIGKAVDFISVKKTLVAMLKAANILNLYDKGDQLARMILETDQEDQRDVLKSLLACYHDYPEMTFVVLSLDFDYMGADDPLINYRTQLNELIQLKYDYKDKILPFVCADPRRAKGKDLVAFVREYIDEKGFSGIKLYPALGFFPFDPALYELYKYAEEEQIPIITHCDRGGIFYQGITTLQHTNPLHISDYISDSESGFSLKKNSRNVPYPMKPMASFKDNFTDPAGYREVLKLFPSLKLCFAHFGGAQEIKASLKQTDTWFARVLDFLRDPAFPNVYADISYTLHDKEAMKILLPVMDEEPVRSRVLFGTDYFLVQREEKEGDLVSGLLAQVGSTFDVIANENPIRFLTRNIKLNTIAP